jgi:hypothetical protein
MKNGILHHDKLNGDNDLHIFDSQLTDVYLEKYDELIHEHVSFHDIVSLTLFKNDDDITILPNSLKYLYIKSGTFTNLPISETVASNIEVIFLDFTNLEHFPDISGCTKLREITINHSNLQSLSFNYSLPPSLQILNVRYNNISDIDFTLFKSNPNLTINLSYNKLNSELIDTILTVNPKADIKMQNRYTFRRINSYNYNNIEIRNMMNNIQVANNAANANNANNVPRQGNVLQGNSQTVHLSSINKSIIKSYKNILAYIDTHKLPVDKNYKSLIDEINKAFNKVGLKSESKICGLFSKALYSTNRTKSFLMEKLDDISIHSILKIRYVELLSLIWSIVKNHEQRENLIERFHSEIDDSLGHCFTGCMNRLINVLVGYIDGVVVSISIKEEIQMSVQILMDKLNKKQLDYRQTKEELVKLLNQEYDIDSSDKNNIISDEYKESWLFALRDYKPDAILCKFYEKVKINERDDRLDGYYYIAYDDLIYNSEKDFDEEKKPIGEISNKDKLMAKIFTYTIDFITYPEKYLNYRL